MTGHYRGLDDLGTHLDPCTFQFLFIALPSEATLSHRSLFSHLDTTHPCCPLPMSRGPLSSLQTPGFWAPQLPACCSAVHQQVVPLNMVPRIRNDSPCAVSPARRCALEAVFTVSSSLGRVFSFCSQAPCSPWSLALRGEHLVISLLPFPKMQTGSVFGPSSSFSCLIHPLLPILNLSLWACGFL